MPIGRIDFGRVKAAVTVFQALDLVGWSPTITYGLVKRGPCPICHAQIRRSRYFVAVAHGWYCNACHRRGDVIRLWQEVHHQTARDAAGDLIDLFDLDRCNP
jgi:hypothetical protein